MCLSTVYKNKLSPETIVMKNVMKVECREGMVILTDLMERQVAVEGQLQEANPGGWLRHCEREHSRVREDPDAYLQGSGFAQCHELKR